MSRFRPVISERLPSRTHFAELFLAPGPERIGVTGDNSYATMFGFDWLLVWDRDDGLLHLYQERGGAWVEVLDDVPPVFGQPVPEGARRWSLAFDQSARVILAYEDGAGIVRVTRWEPSSNSYVQNVSFAGADPCVVMDASWSLSVPGSDVLLFYLSPDRQRVLCRVQRDVYAVEHELWTFDAPVILDRVVAVPIRYQALLSDVEGTPLPQALVSDPYPYLGWDRLGVQAVGPVAGAYEATVVLHEQHEALTVVASGPASGTYADPLVSFELVEPQVIAVSASGPTGGAYADPIINYVAFDGLAAAAAGPTAGAYTLAVLQTELSGEGIDVTATGPTGGTYENA